MDSLNSEVLCLPSSVNVTIGTTINQVYNLFICKTAAGAVSVQTDTSVDGVNLTGTYDYFRWIGFVRNNSSGVICLFTMKGNMMAFGINTESIIGGASATFIQIDHSSFFPESRIATIKYGVRRNATTGGVTAYTSLDGVSTENTSTVQSSVASATSADAWGTNVSSQPSFMPYDSQRYFKSNTGYGDWLCRAVTMKR